MGLAEIISYNLTNLSSNIIKRGGFVYCSTMLCITLLWKDDIHMGKKANTNKFQINMKNIHLIIIWKSLISDKNEKIKHHKNEKKIYKFKFYDFELRYDVRFTQFI